MLKELFLSKTLSSLPDSNTIDTLRLIRSENVGPRTFFALLKLFGTATAALEHIAEFSVHGGRAKPITVCSQQSAIQELELLYQHQANIITYYSPQYSKLLLEIPDFPPILSYKGNIGLLSQLHSVAIVGARNASANGKAFAAKLASELAKYGYAIISGFARGIDTAAHQAALNKTIAVFAGGIDYVYPPENQKLYDQIVEQGLIVCELPIGTKPLGQNFPQRNRIIAGLSLGAVVIEAGLKSGSLLTAKFALEQNREVFAVPGFPLDPRCQGSNKLIKEGAHLIESTQDVIDHLLNYGWSKKSLADSCSNDNTFHFLDSNQIQDITDNMRKTILKLLAATPTSFDSIVQAAQLPIPIVYTIMLELELAGKVLRCPGNKFCLVFK